MFSLNRFAKYSWGVLVYIIGVVIWGAFVRATGSGAGCGSHWPLCNGEIVPQAKQVETLIEFAHRLTSGLAFILVLALFVWARRVYVKGHIIRLGAGWAMLFMISESLVGAGLVLFEWVAGNISVARVIVMGVHLTNTFMLMAFLTLTSWWASGGNRLSWSDKERVNWALILSFLAVLFLSMAGAVTALGDTLFPSASLVEGIQQDFSSTAHFLIRLRVWHPVIAVLVGMFILLVVRWVPMEIKGKNGKKTERILVTLYVIQLGAGLLNLVLLAPVFMQLVHLLLAALVWIVLVIFAANVWGYGSEPALAMSHPEKEIHIGVGSA